MCQNFSTLFLIFSYIFIVYYSVIYQLTQCYCFVVIYSLFFFILLPLSSRSLLICSPVAFSLQVFSVYLHTGLKTSWYSFQILFLMSAHCIRIVQMCCFYMEMFPQNCFWTAYDIGLVYITLSSPFLYNITRDLIV